MHRAALALFSMLQLVCANPAQADILSGPVEARVLRVIDGDTFIAEAKVWPGHSVKVSVRIRGIDAPEIRSRCPEEKAAAGRARDLLTMLVASGTVKLFNIGGGKYHGRVLADVVAEDGEELAPVLLGHDVVRPYAGGRRVPFCQAS